MDQISSLQASFTSLVKLLETGGPVVSILLALSVFVSTIILLKLWQFLRLGFFNRPRIHEIINNWIAGQKSVAYQRLLDKKNPTAKVMAHAMRGLQQPNINEQQMREDVERVAEIEMTKVRSYFPAIEAVVQIAPLLGLFGTVIGMIEAFQKLQGAGAEVDPSILAGGIWVALLTTAVGLAVAIPSALILYWFEAMADREQHNIETAVTSLMTQCITDDMRPTENVIEASSNLNPSEHAA